MKILFLGYSNLFRRRILRVLIKNKIKFCIASKSFKKKEKKAYKWFRNYALALNKSNADMVYITLPNSYHSYWAKKALEKNYHVIVDKQRPTLIFTEIRNQKAADAELCAIQVTFRSCEEVFQGPFVQKYKLNRNRAIFKD